MSTLKVTNIQDTAGGNSSTSEEIYSGRAKAWVNFNGVGTVAIRADFNVNSITDNGGNGDYTVNFTTAMPDANYCVTGTCSGADNPSSPVAILNTKLTGGLTTTGCRIYSTNTSGAAANREFIAVAIFR